MSEGDFFMAETVQDITRLFGSNVFNQKLMKERLPKETYKALLRTIDSGSGLEPDVANVVANAMKDWAVERGATHYTHWFQPLTGRGHDARPPSASFPSQAGYDRWQRW